MFRDQSFAVKALAVCAAGALLSLGLCGLGSVIKDSGGSAMAIAGALLFCVCIVGGVILLLIIAFGKLIGGLKR
jgi:hypothetical protein